MKQLLEQDIDALLAASDLTAVGAEALNEVGVKVPDDTPWLGSDDLPYGTEIAPLTVHQPIHEKGRATARCSIHRRACAGRSGFCSGPS
jgi:DNA-binding LacI/PurR family transcriptional regulator